MISLSILLLLGATAQEPSLDKPVTFAMPAASARSVVAALAKATGARLDVGADVATEVLVVDVRDAPLGTLLTKIAVAAGASWMEENGARRLVRPAEQASAEEAECLKARATAIGLTLDRLGPSAEIDAPMSQEQAVNTAIASKTALDELLDRMQKGGDDGQILRKVGELGAKTSAGRMLLRAARLIGAPALAEIPAGRRVVYALHPTPLQRAFPGGFDSALQTFVADHAKWLAALQNVPPAKAHVTGGPDLQARAPLSTVSDVHLVVSRLNGGDAIDLDIAIADQNGTVASEAHSTVAPEPAGTSTIGSDRKIAIPEEAAAFVKAWDSVRGAGAKPTVSKWTDVWSDPATHEPLSFCAGSLLSAAAQVDQLNLVASLPDRALLPSLAAARSTNLSVSALFRSLDGWGMRASVDGGWLVAAPSNPAEQRRLRIDRQALTTLFKASVGKRQAMLVDLGAYALRRPSGLGGVALDSNWIILLAARVDNAVTASGLLIGEGPMLRFFGSVSQAQQRTLVGGGELPIGNLSQPALKALDEMVYHSLQGPQVGKAQSPYAMAMRESRPLSNERTRTLPNGVPRDGSVALAVSRAQGYQLVASESGAARILAGNDLLATLVGGQMDAKKGKPILFDRFRSAIITGYAFTFRLKPEVSLSKNLSEPIVDRTAALMTYEQLPADLRAQVDQIVANSIGLGGSRFGVPGGGGGGRKDPPPSLQRTR